MEADVILAAERPRVGQRGRRDDVPQVGARPQSPRHLRKQPGWLGLLHEPYERLDLAELQTLGTVVPGGEGRGELEVDGRFETDGGDQHPLGHLREELSTGSRHHETAS